MLLLVWNLFDGPHESGYIYLFLQSSPLAQCSTTTTFTIQTGLCSVPLWTELVGGVMVMMCEPASFFSAGT